MAREAISRTSLYGFEVRESDARRLPDGEARVVDIKQMWQRHHEMVNLAARGFSNIEIAEILNVTPQTVSNTLNSQLGEQKLSEIRFGRDQEAKMITEKIKALTNKAIETYHQVFDNENGEVSLKDKSEIAKTVLNDLSGLKAPVRIQSFHTTLSAEDLSEFKRRGIEAAKESGLVIDVKVEDDSPEDVNS